MNPPLYRLFVEQPCKKEATPAAGLSDPGHIHGPSLQHRFLAPQYRRRVRLLSVCKIVCMGSLTSLLSWYGPAHARIVADTTAPGTRQPTVLSTASGVPQVNIQTPSSAGVSRNAYNQFDIDSQGAILNNSRTATGTQIGGYVAGNPWLAGGSAGIILNEVNSSDPSQLKGYVEVAGQRAEVVIANPSGINVDGAGFINASRATLVTGTAQMSGGDLTGYQVRDGQITVTGGGLDAGSTDYTDLISRSVAVNAGIWAGELRVTTGANQVDAANTTATPIAGSGPAPTLSIDVAQLGGMYAGKIKLVGTEAGVGVRNAGNIGASAGEVVVTADGHLENSGRISATGNISLDPGRGAPTVARYIAKARPPFAPGEISPTAAVW